ncbi:MAG TPA: TonB-dependent hemoglobin/transferrin/lactoferrin family receptor [Steroidobacteraceae bacterium]|nr:TonB-dependent hemoglobin/transferrin/lactoferrin family receptor [Steroidobacteraceae bacterium]
MRTAPAPASVRPSRVLRLALASVLLSAGAATTAAEPAAATDDPLETVTVYARRITPVTRVAATVTVVDQARIEATLASDIRELVRYEPGLTVRNDPFRFGLDSLSIRGLGGNRVAVEIDGIPAAGGFAVGSYADSGRAFLDTAFVERVEFLRGPASSLYGSEAIGGIVAMRTLAPRHLLSQGREALGLRTEAGYDSQDEGWHAAALLAGQAGPGDWLLGYVRREGHEVDTAADVEPDPREYTSDAVLAKYVLSDVAGGPLTLAFEGGRLEQQTAVDAFLGVGRFVNTTLLEGDDRMQRHRVSIDHALGAGGGWFDSADWRAYWQGTETDQDTHEVRRAAPPRSPAVDLDRSFAYDEATFGAEFTAAKSLGSSTLTHDFVYGVEATRTRLEELRNGLQTTIDTGETTASILGEDFPLRDMPLTDLTEVGVFVQDEIRPANARWTLVPALRIDYYELSPDVDRIYREDNPSAPAVSVEETSFAPKLGATWHINDALTAFFQYAHGFRSPPPEDVNIGLEIPLFRIRAVPNPDLDPETSDGYELGLRVRNSALSLTASVFQTEYDDFIESKVNIGADATGVTLFQSQNVAEARIYGAELSSLADLGAWSPALEGWSGRLAASWTQGKDLVRDEPLNSIDPPRLVLALRYDAPSQRWGSELVVTAVEAQREVDRSLADLYRTDGYATLDLLAHWRFSERFRLNLGLFNLTDAEYIEWADVRGRTTDDVLVPYYTQPGFNASATLHYAF